MLLFDLCRARGVSGAEHEVRRVLRDYLEPGADEVIVDSLGNLLCMKRGGSPDTEPFTVMVAAHMDEIGFMITNIRSSGLLDFGLVGGMDPRTLLGSRVRIGREGVRGVIGMPAAPRGSEGSGKEVVALDALRIDIGALSREEAEQAVTVGDYATFDSEPESWPGGKIKGRALDDRVGCAILAEVFEEGHYPFTLWAAFTTQEEIGLRGARTASYRIEPDLGLALEGCICADIPGSRPENEATRLGGGAALSIMDRTSIPHPAIRRELMRLAEELDIKYQHRRATFGGNDAGPISQSRGGVPTAVISVPCRYIHTSSAVCSQEDIGSVKRLLSGFLDSVGQGFRPSAR